MKCEYCNEELIQRLKEKTFDFGKRRFCGLKCFGQWRRLEALKGIKRTCKRCGKELEPNMNEMAYRFRRRKVCGRKSCVPPKVYIKKPNKKCKNCGEPCYSVYCSKKCRVHFWEKTGRYKTRIYVKRIKKDMTDVFTSHPFHIATRIHSIWR